MATNTLTAGNDTVSITQGNSGTFWGKSYDGGAGIDTMSFSDSYAGYAGNFSLTADAAGVVTMSTGSGSCTFVNFEAIKLGTTTINLGTAGNDSITGGSKADTFLYGLGGDDTIDGGLGADKMMGGAGNDTYIVDNASDNVVEALNDGTDTIKSSVAISALAANVENLILTGATAINGTGNTLDNVITGNSANNTLTGGGGTDTVVYAGNKASFTVTATDATHATITGAGFGTDTLSGITNIQFNDGIVTIASYLVVAPPAIIDGTAGNDTLTGNASNNTINGLAGNDILTASGGVDTMNGGLGDDTYNINDASGHVVFENANEGTDTVNSAVTYTLTANVENLTLTGNSMIDGTGNSAVNVITGNSSNNSLNGGAGADSLVGGGGTDTAVYSGSKASYSVTATDATHGSISGGVDGGDTLNGITFLQFSDGIVTLASYLPPPASVITGTAGNDTNLQGTNAADTVNGLGGDDTIDGLGGIDVLNGGTGNDIYVVDTATDTINENTNEGIDTVRSSVTQTALANNVENLTLTGSAAINGSGNSLANTITGNGGNNILTGGAGDDTLVGGGGSDTAVYSGLKASYTVTTSDGISGTVTGPDGTDTLTNITNLQFSDGVVTLMSFKPTGGGGGGPINGTDAAESLAGTASNDIIHGFGGNDIIDGKGGNDTMDGGAGNDVYYVDSVNDYVRELANNGQDTICSAVSLNGLRIFVEDLKLIGGATKGVGNSDANVITGNAAANLLVGLAGNDTLKGGLGADRLTGGMGKDALTGGGGKDVFDFDGLVESKVGASRDVIKDFVHGSDRLDLSTIDANGSGAGNSAFLLQFGKGLAFTGLKGLVHFAWQGANTIVEGDVNGDRMADFQIELSGHVALTKADFIL